VPLSDEDVREILRLIDESELDELHVETEAFSLHVERGRPTDATAPAPAAIELDAGDLVTVTAPMIGTFYRAEAPGAPPFVEVGARVEPATVVCLIEVMKMMNAVPAGTKGTVVEVLAENAQPVEYGAPLFLVQPAA
jgi:acetyl-CoA carboxylase biotin carboxyl carrier protein